MVDSVLEVLQRLTGCPRQGPSLESTVVDFANGERLLTEHTEGLLGSATPGRGVRIMVTMSGEAAEDGKAWIACASIAPTMMERLRQSGS